MVEFYASRIGMISNSLEKESHIQPYDHLSLIQNKVLILKSAMVEMALDLLHF